MVNRELGEYSQQQYLSEAYRGNANSSSVASKGIQDISISIPVSWYSSEQ